MIRSAVRPALLGAALVAAGGGALAQDRPALTPTAAVPPSGSSAFIQSFLAPKMSARLEGSRAAVASEFSNPAASPWTSRLADTEDEVRRGAIRATKSAIKKYAVERLNLTGWSLPLRSGGGKGIQAFRTESGGPRLRFGFSHRAPSAEALLPLDRGRLSFSATLLGRVGTSFETPGGRLRVGATVDPLEGTATAGLTVAF